eukprot:14894269-Alexandrium_andersonii.AAC.1
MGVGGRPGAPRSGRHGATERGAGPSVRALAPVPIGATRAAQERRLPQPQRAGGGCTPAAPPSLLQVDSRCLPA